MLILTMGDPNGLGPEIICRLLGRPGRMELDGPVLMIGPEDPLIRQAESFNTPMFWQKLGNMPDRELPEKGIFLYSPPQLEGLDYTLGQASRDGGLAAGISLEIACIAMKEGLGSALVTCPLDKHSLIQAGYNFPGHTEFLAKSFGLKKEEVCMHLLGEKLAVSLASTHVPLAEVSGELGRERILNCLRLTWKLIRSLGRENRPMAVCGLNPHAGEGGELGLEEIEVIEPALKQAKVEGIWASGPWPGDSVFSRAAQGEFSAVLAMYHDQGLAPLKLVDFGRAANITLGLPVVRTSVDHGTGYDLVGTGKASWLSLKKAVQLAFYLS